LKGRYRVTLYAKEGTYALSVPKSRLGYLLLPVARVHPFEIRLKPPVSVDVPRGVKPVGKAARKTFTYTPLRIRPKKEETSKEAEKPAEKSAAQTPPPKIEEITSATFSMQAEQNKQSTKTPKRGGRSKNTTTTKKGGKTTQTKGGKTKKTVAA